MKNNKGLSAIELMVSIGIIAITVGIVFTPRLEIQKIISNMDNKSGRIFTNYDIKNKILDSEFSLSKSALTLSENADLCPCTQGGSFFSGATKVCTLSECRADVETEFSFYDPKATTIPVKVSGTNALPAYFSAAGDPCPGVGAAAGSDPEVICAYKNITKFKAHCAGDLPTCDHADYLIVTLESIPIGTNQKFRSEKTQIVYSVPLNYNPILDPVANQNLILNEQKKIPVNANAGQALEVQQFIYEQCSSSNSAIVEIRCYKFVNGVSQIVITGHAAGTAIMTLQANDGGAENPLSAPISFNVTVTP